MAPIEAAAAKAEKKLKKEKKRAREDDAPADAERKHKKSKSVAAEVSAPEVANGDLKKKKKKSKKDKHAEDAVEQPEVEAAAVEEPKSEKKKHKKKHHDADDVAAADTSAVVDGEKKKKHKKKHKVADTTDEVAESKKHKKSKKDHHPEEPEAEAQTTAEEPQQDSSPADPDAMDVDFVSPAKPSKSKSKIHQPPDIPANPQFPFFTQTVSLYEPLYPIGWAQPVTSCQYQHLRHLQNKYVPSLRGVLLDYKNVAFGEKPGRKGAALDDESPATVMARDEAAVGFGWITADVDLFVPSRGAWMEGSVNLQTEGHIGVVCFGKFNASIEARRLPPDWTWVPNESPEAQGFEETASVITADDHGVVRQIHSTGFWADGSGDKVKGKIRFRIRNFDVGTSGETSYLSLEGTMLDRQGEKAVVAEEAETAKMRKGKKGAGAQRRGRRRVPELSMTRFAVDEEEQTQDNEQEKREVLAVSED